MELCIGTVQFGMDYGILGQMQPSLEKALACLNHAVNNGIRAIDTAAAYGNAEDVVGAFLRQSPVPREELFISTKLLPNSLDDVERRSLPDAIRDHLEGSLRRLGTDYVDAYMLHSSRYAFRNDILEALDVLREDGLARKVGVSVYDPDEARLCAASPHVSFVQAPYSVFDHRLKESGALGELERADVEVHTRSAFIQGLILLRSEEVPHFLEGAKPILDRLDRVCAESGCSRVQLAMAYVKREHAISHLVFGVDSLDQLAEDIDLFDRPVEADILALMDEEFADIPAEVVMPSLWKRS